MGCGYGSGAKAKVFRAGTTILEEGCATDGICLKARRQIFIDKVTTESATRDWQRVRLSHEENCPCSDRWRRCRRRCRTYVELTSESEYNFQDIGVVSGTCSPEASDQSSGFSECPFFTHTLCLELTSSAPLDDMPGVASCFSVIVSILKPFQSQ